MYIHELQDWPNFRWDQSRLSNLLTEVRYAQGRLLGRMDSLGFPLRQQATLETLTTDVVKTSEIEGEKLSVESVRSSIARRLGLDIGALRPVDRNVEGIVELMLDATRNFARPLTAERLFGWQAALFPTGRSGLQRITVGAWRPGPMRVISGRIGEEKVHFEAPGQNRLGREMVRFLKWFNSSFAGDLVFQSALSHFWFVTIHPFEDANGRIARAIADMLLARSEGTAQRFYSMSAQIRQERSAYYEVLERSQKGTLDISPWIEWYLNCLKRALGTAENTLKSILLKDRFWKESAGDPLNERQRKVLNRLLDAFEVKLTSSKWAKLAKCSQDTALRDITDLIDRGILVKESAGGRSTGYLLKPLA